MAKSCLLCISEKAQRRYSLMAQPFKHPKTGIYYIRRKVPPALRDLLGREYKVSLKTHDLNEAKGRFALEWSKADSKFALALKQREGHQVISLEKAEDLASGWFQVAKRELKRTGAFTDLLASGSATAWERGDQYSESQRYVTLRESMEQHDDIDWQSAVHPHISRTLKENGLPMPEDGSTEYGWLLSEFGECLEKLSRWALAKHEGEWIAGAIDDAPRPQQVEAKEETPTPAKKARSLHDLFLAYSEDKKLNDGDSRSTRKTLGEFESDVNRFRELHGELDVSQIGRETVRAHRVFLAKMPVHGKGQRGLTAPALVVLAEQNGLSLLSGATIRKKLNALSAILSYGVRLGWLTENPVIASGIGKAASKAAAQSQAANRQRKDYTKDELAAIFNSPAFNEVDWSPPRVNFGKAWYWLPLLLYYTGARREELAQLNAADIKRSDEGYWHLDILATSQDDGKRGVKNESSRRLIPLHSDLIKRGLLGYVANQTGQLFPQLKADPKGYFGSNFGKHWGMYIRQTVGLSSTASPSHGFRHTFKTLCREVGIPEDVHDAITGHAGNGSVARDYGSMPLSRMVEELGKLPTISDIASTQLARR